MTTSGVVGIAINVSGVSSGNTYDSGNGFIVEQAMMTPFGLPTKFSRQFTSLAAELQSCMKYYESSVGNSATCFSGNVTSGSAYFAQCNYKAMKRFADVTNPPTLTNVNNVSFSTSTSLDNHTVYGFRSTRIANATGQGLYEESFTADAEIY
jgi:uridine phosphorylase